MPITEEKRVKDFPPRQSGLLPADVIPVDSNAGGTGSVTVQQLMEANISGLTTDATTVINAINELKAQGFKTIALTQAQYDLLPDTKLTDGIAYYITDGIPDVDNSLWTKVGRETLTIGSSCSDGINQLKQSLSDLTSNDELYKTSNVGDTSEHEFSLNYSALNYLFITIEISWLSASTFTGILTIPSAVWVKTNGTDTTRIYTNNNPSNSYIEVLTRSSGKIKVKASNANVGLRITGIGKIV